MQSKRLLVEKINMIQVMLLKLLEIKADSILEKSFLESLKRSDYQEL
jgi:hypothetical protein